MVELTVEALAARLAVSEVAPTELVDDDADWTPPPSKPGGGPPKPPGPPGPPKPPGPPGPPKADRSLATAPRSLSKVARLELVSVRLDVRVEDVADAVDTLDVDEEAPPDEPECTALEISFSADCRVDRSCDNELAEEAPVTPVDVEELVEDELSPDAPVLCREVRRDSTEDENWSDGDDCCGGAGGGPLVLEDDVLPLPCTFCPLLSALLAELAAFVPRELIRDCNVCRAEVLETLDVCTIYSFRS